MSPDGPKKQRTIIRMLSTKFATAPRIQPLPAPPSAYSKDSRDAALRARGLLPPQPRDLSVQEKEHDQHIPVLQPTPPSPSITDADLVKNDWVARNSSVERQRMTSFKFGGSSLPPTPPRSPVNPSTLLDHASLFPPPPTALPPLPPKNQLPTPPQSPPSPVSPRSHLSDDTPHCDAAKPSHDDVLSAAFHLRDDSFAQLEHTVLPTPTDSHPIKSKKPRPGKSPTPLQVKTHQPASIPVIVDSPVSQHRFSQDLHVVHEEVLYRGSEEREKHVLTPLTIPMTAPATVTITPAPNLNNSPISADHHPPALAPARKRGMTDSTAAGARKLLNSFKRDKDKPLPPSPTAPLSKASGENTSPPTLRPRRLTMSASLSNLRRSFVGTLSRPSNSNTDGSSLSVGGKKSFNASHLPPSPTIPAAFAVQASSSLDSRLHSAGGGGSGESSHDRDVISPTPTATARIARQPQPVVIYNRGSILLETANIEDDEVRRMTELAFLG